MRIRMGLLRFEALYSTDIVVHMRSEGEDSVDSDVIDKFFLSWVDSFKAEEKGLKALLNL